MRVSISCCLMAFALAACSAEQKTVPNRPPEIPAPPFLKTGVPEEPHAGRMHVAVSPRKVQGLVSMMAFLWPEFSSEDEAVRAVVAVNGASKEIDRLTPQILQLKAEENRRSSEFKSLECAIKWAELDEDEDPEDIDWIERWKPDPMDDPDASKSKSDCMANQEARRLIFETSKAANQSALERLGEIYAALGPGAGRIEPGLIVSEGMSEGRSQLEITQTEKGFEVRVRLVDFQGKGVVQSTQPQETSIEKASIRDAIYDARLRVLMFKVPEIKNGEVTGRVYEFQLERAPFLMFTRFAGDLKLTGPGQRTRLGSVSFYGLFQ